MIRESASAGVIWKCWSNISFRLDSAILLSASRRLPLYPKPSARAPGADGSGGGGERAGAGERGRETLDRGLKRPIEDLQTRFHPLSPIPLPLNLPLLLVSLSLSLSLPIEPSPTLRAPSFASCSSFSFLDLRQRSDWSSTPDCADPSEMTNCPAKQSGMRNSENTRIKVLVRRPTTTTKTRSPRSRTRALFQESS